MRLVIVLLDPIFIIKNYLNIEEIIMIGDVLFFMKNRKIHPFMSKLFFRAWAKRILNFKSMIVSLFRCWALRVQGANLGRLVIIEKTIINGKKSHLFIGKEVFIGSGCLLELHEKLIIEDNVVVNSGVSILTASHSTSSSEWLAIQKKIVIKKNAWIATNAIILPGVTIGEGAVIGAGAVVSKDVPDGALAIGNPVIIKLGIRPSVLNYKAVNGVGFVNAWFG